MFDSNVTMANISYIKLFYAYDEVVDYVFWVHSKKAQCPYGQ